MRKRILSTLLCLMLAAGLLTTAAFAATDETAVYVSSSGSDESGNGTEASPYATLAKAAKNVSGTGHTTIYVLSDLTVSGLAYFTQGDITITSGEGGPFSISRSESFATNNDARSWYNPAMIEVSGSSANPTKLTLENIVLSDGGNKSGSHFIDARPNNGGQTNGVSHTDVVQDAMIASYNGTGIITLGDGAVLKDFGGMSAVRVTKDNDEQLGGMLIMKDGSKICDEKVSDRTKKTSDDYGPAGAVWLNGGELIMEAGSEICNVVGRAVYADGGSVEIGGTISGIKGDADMWQGIDGTALHLRNNATAEFSGKAENCTGGVMVKVDKATFEMKEGSFIGNSNVSGIKVNENLPGDYTGKPEDYNTIIINGEISGITGYQNSPIQFKYGVLTIGKAAKIHDNSVHYGAVYLQRDAIAHIYGKIYNNIASGRGGGIGTAGHGFVEIYVYAGAEIKNNTAKETGGGASLKTCKLTMYGGEISGNTGKTGGGIYLYSDATADILGGTITDNTADIGSNDLAVTSSNCGTESIYLFISDKALIGNPAVYMEKNTKTVSPIDRNIKLHNASTDSITALKNASINDKGWADPLATFWVQRDGGAGLTVGGLTLDKTLPVYVLTQKTGADGKPDSGAAVNAYAAAVDADGNVSFTLPTADVNGNGCAVAIVQPTQDFGTLTISGPETIKQNKTGEDYPVTYTVTYDMSEGLRSIIEQAGGTAEYSLVITADDRLDGTPGSFDGNSMQVTYTLPNSAFAAGDSLFASAELTVTVGQNSYVIPSNAAETKLLGLESFDVVFDWNDGSGKTETVSVTEGEALGDGMIADPTRSGYTFTGWNTQQDGKGSSFDKSTAVTGSLTVYAQWSETSSGGNTGTYYYFAVEKVDAQDGHTLSGARFGLYLDGRQIADATSGSSGIALFRVDESDYRKITAGSKLYYQELAAPDGYVMRSGRTYIEKSGLTASRAAAEKSAATVRNYRSIVPADLNGSDHVAYVHGYSDGTVRPNHKITRAETAVMLYRLLTDARKAEIQTSSNSFTDVSPDAWYNEAVSTMANGKYIAGYSDGTFRGNKRITRAEFVAILVRFIGVQDETCDFSDVSKDHWAYDYIATATQAGWIAGYADGSFRPEKDITRAEAMTIINRVLNRGVDGNSELLDFKAWPDNTASDWFYYEVIEATNGHEYTGARPSEQWTKLVDR